MLGRDSVPAMKVSARFVLLAAGCGALRVIPALGAGSAAALAAPGIVETNAPLFPRTWRPAASTTVKPMSPSKSTRPENSRIWSSPPTPAGSSRMKPSARSGPGRLSRPVTRGDSGLGAQPSDQLSDRWSQGCHRQSRPSGRKDEHSGQPGRPFRLSRVWFRELDRTPVPRHVVEPQGFPSQASGPVVIEFYIDEQGRVRVRGEGGRNAAFANAALAAVSQWRFDPPTRGGRRFWCVRARPSSLSRRPSLESDLDVRARRRTACSSTHRSDTGSRGCAPRNETVVGDHLNAAAQPDGPQQPFEGSSTSAIDGSKLRLHRLAGRVVPGTSRPEGSRRSHGRNASAPPDCPCRLPGSKPSHWDRRSARPRTGSRCP